MNALPLAPPLRLLVVDDSAPVGRALARIARALGWVVDAVTSWSEGELLLRRGHYDCLLVDHVLGGEISGAQAIARARAAWPAVPAALMSGTVVAEEAAATVGCPVLVKPFGRDEFAALLARAAATARAAPA